MTSALPLFRTIGYQLLIVSLVILSLPIVVRILWKLRLFPLGCYFVATKLFWPCWALAHRTACILSFVGCVLDRALHPTKTGGTDHGRVSSSLYKGPEARRIPNA